MVDEYTDVVLTHMLENRNDIVSRNFVVELTTDKVLESIK